ncbi:hypothetical protein [Actinomadura verrucosospora]|uniref:Uncharacterized protein n=1 Tax=Actinomadura verrucosospora TaxID=46165 RepID=A0A7D3W106_ACTVE|nr:hypothetical protein [Actinomadura verrucosospora]QKG23551.1 hypothetical protein ACTIVE_5194 [Actinomadura verrucosospora]
MANRTISGDPLAALAAHLSAHRLTVELTSRGLRVANPDAPGCCAEVGRASDLITCRARPEDFGAAWFWTSWGEPIARADRLTDAAVFVRGYLAGAGR